MFIKTVQLEGHLLDSLILSKILDHILNSGAYYELLDISVGQQPHDISSVKLFIRSENQVTIDALTAFVKEHGGTIPEPHDVKLMPSPADGVLPDGFYSTTNLETDLRVNGREIRVEGEAMDLAIVVYPVEGRAVSTPMDEAKKGDLFVVGSDGVIITPLKTEQGRKRDLFGFMQSDVSVEKPRHQSIEEVAKALKDSRESGGKSLLVLGPAVVHSGASDILARIIKRKTFDVLFGGNAIAAHDIEYALYGTSLGVNLKDSLPVKGGHQHHMRAINTIRAAGGIRNAIEKGILTSGIMHSAYTSGVDVFLGGSIRDDGPLPEVCVNILQAKKIMREKLKGVKVAVMVATALHSIATGNLLKASVKTFCVDINTETVTKLMDRGSLQITPIVMDCESFFREILELL